MHVIIVAVFVNVPRVSARRQQGVSESFGGTILPDERTTAAAVPAWNGEQNAWEQQRQDEFIKPVSNFH
jgi:hypothetical protein